MDEYRSSKPPYLSLGRALLQRIVRLAGQMQDLDGNDEGVLLILVKKRLQSVPDPDSDLPQERSALESLFAVGVQRALAQTSGARRSVCDTDAALRTVVRRLLASGSAREDVIARLWFERGMTATRIAELLETRPGVVHLIITHRGGPREGVPGECPRDAHLAAWLDGPTPVNGRLRVGRHVATCGSCFETVLGATEVLLQLRDDRGAR